jgi:hypothetical protein
LYAKALALLGLGLLGAAGALVDYWPVQGELPAVEAKLALPPAFELPNLNRPSPPTAVLASARRVVSAVPDTDAADLLAAGAVESESTEASITMPPSLAVAPMDTTRMPVSTLDLTPPVISAPELAPFAPVQMASNGDNVFTGAAKKSGRAMAKTGEVIASGFATGVTSVASAFGRVFRF